MRPLALLLLGLFLATLLPVEGEAGRRRGGGSSGPAPVFDSDDFDVYCEFPLGDWVYEDPVGDGSIEIVGTGTADAHLRLSVPAGVTHDLWSDADRAPRLLQPARDVDFVAKAKFESDLTEGYQGQGILVEATSTSWIRFDVFHDGSKVRAFAATRAGGTATTRIDVAVPASNPMWMRVTRTGSSWTFEHSADGQSWQTAGSFTHALAVSRIGPFVLNYGSSPAQTPGHTAVVDYFYDMSAPLLTEDDDPRGTPGPKILDLQAEGPGSAAAEPAQADYTCGTPITLTATPDSGATFSTWSGIVSTSENPTTYRITADSVVKGNFEFDTTPPVVSDVAIDAGSTSALVTWTTDDPADSRVDYGETTSYALGTESDAAFVTAHQLALTNLEPGTDYHLRITSVNENGLATETGDFPFTTAPAGSGGPAGLVSDDFDRRNVDTGVWSLFDPKNDANFLVEGAGSSDAQLVIEVPGGVDHEVSATRYDAPRAMQEVSDGDFEVEAKFESPVAEKYQIQGLVVEATSTHYLRFDFHGDGSGDLRAYVAAFVDGSQSVKLDTALPSAFSPAWMRVRRQGDQWTLSWSSDGQSWTGAVSFAHPMEASRLGVFASNEGDTATNAPALRSRVDYFFDTSAPVVPEDGQLAEDALPPLLQHPAALPGTGSAEISWVTDEPATTVVRYGTSSSYELGSLSEPGTRQKHSLLLDGLAADTTYHFQVESADGLDQTSTSADFTFQTTSQGGGGAGPVIDVWYGLDQSFGQLGIPQPFVNLLGNVSDPDGVSSLTYALNDGLPQPLTIGPTNTRVAEPGDFNADIPASDLDEGSNTVFLTAKDVLGNTSVELVNVEFESDFVWPLPYSITDWSSVSDVQDVAQVVDGLWAIEGGEIRSLQAQYDRLVAIGDLQWTDYEVEVPITLHDFNAEGFSFPSNRPGVGLVLRWVGHSDAGSQQPEQGIDPLGAIGLYRLSEGGPPDRLEMWTNESPTSPGKSFTLEFGVPYVFKMRVETVSGLGPLYSLKVWPEGSPEPADWDLQEQQTTQDLPNGSLVLLAHEVDASFGPVSVTPLP